MSDHVAPTSPWGPLALSAVHGPIERSYWVVEDRLVGGAYPFDIDPERGRSILDTLQSSGVDTFVNLTRNAEPESTDAHLVGYERIVDESTVVLSHPITDLGVPTRTEMIAILDAIDQRLGEGRTLYVHCWGGIGRTGTVIGCWLVRHQLAASDQALDVLARLRKQDQVAGRRRSPETPDQRLFVETWRSGE